MHVEEIPIIIPSLEPDERLINIVKEILALGMKNIVVVNDGSGREYEKIFDAIEGAGVVVLRHAVNLGKGRALKTAFNYCLNTFVGLCGVVTADSDGQHTAKNIKKCAEALALYKDKLVLGVRDFSVSGIPFRSRFGNKVTVVTLNAVCGIKVADTQTGLRAIPAGFMKKLLSIPGERFEYETNMLIETKEMGIDIYEVPIETIYQKEEYSSHFNPLKDSIKIYRIFAKFIFSSMLSTLVDFIMFTIFISCFKEILPQIYILISTVMARIFSAVVNFQVNRKVVFKSKNNNVITVIEYIALCIFIMICSAGLVTILYRFTQFSEVILKALVDTCLFGLSFIMQRDIIFRKRAADTETTNIK